MKQIIIPYIPTLENNSLERNSEIIELSGSRNAIESANWIDQYPYKPITFFYIARSKNYLYIKFAVKGTMLKAVYTKDQDPVYKDSCVEFFCEIPNGDGYVNFEFNCIGTCSASRRKSRKEGVVYLTPTELTSIKRFPSIGNKAFKEMEGLFEWELTVQIPFSIIGIDPENLPASIKGNFYKCADETDSMHFVSWNPILTERPDFHRPEFFGELFLEEQK